MEKEKSDVQPVLDHIAQYDREFKKWITRSERIVERYRDEKRGTNATARFNILWSNVQTLVPATFSRMPKADVSRRFSDNDPVGRVGSLLLERTLNYEIEHFPDFRAAVRQCVHDRFLGGRGTVWVRYEPNIVTDAVPEDGVQVTDAVEVGDESGAPEHLESEQTVVDYVHWKDFGHQVARTWDEVNVVWRRVFMTRAACITRFGEEMGKKIPLDSKPDKEQTRSSTDNRDNLALIYEIWDKEKKKAFWLAKSLGEFVDERDDPLGLEEFFPCPKPLFSTITNETLVPVPDYVIYQDQAAELDVLADRIQGLIDALQVKGVYNAEFPILARLFTEGENGKMFGVKDFAAFAEKNGMKGAIDLVDLEPIYEALLAAYRAMEEIKRQIYDITGLSDIVRGSSEAQETATAQQIKGQYASMRLNAYKHDVAQFCSDIIRIKAQIIAKYQPTTILEVAGAKQMQPEDQKFLAPALQMIQETTQRQFRIEVAADSLVQMDEDKERADRTQFVASVGTAIKEAGPIIQQAPELAPLMLELIKFAASAYNAGKSIEGTLDHCMDEMKQVIAAKKAAPPQPNPEMLKLQAEQQNNQAKLQLEQARLQQEGQMAAQQAQAQAQADAAKLQAEMVAKEREAQVQAQLDAERNAMEAQREREKLDADMNFQRWKAELEARTKIEIAEISAKATLDAAQQQAASDAADDPV